jgi:hypothetical protein
MLTLLYDRATERASQLPRVLLGDFEPVNLLRR